MERTGSGADQALLCALFEAAVEAAAPRRVLPPALPEDTDAPAVVLGAGKAAAAMAAALVAHWRGALQGVVVVPYGHAVPAGPIEVLEAGHPLPDEAALAAGRKLLAGAARATTAGRLICLLSGGASALACVPPPGISLEEKRALMSHLLRSGADITAINCVRRHLSLLKGGRLALAAAPAKLICYAISDVAGDDPAVIGSGPCVADPSTVADARSVLARYAIEETPALTRWFADPRAESVKPGDPRLPTAGFCVLATPAGALAAATRAAATSGWEVVSLGSELGGEARMLGAAHARLARELHAAGRRCVLLSGGETTVTVRGGGRGGRNTEYLLGLLSGLGEAAGDYAALAADTDGIDGSNDAAGAWFDGERVAAAARLGLAPERALAANDSHAFFATLGTLLRTGPTLTNVNDFRAIRIGGSARAIGDNAGAAVTASGGRA